MKKTIFQILAVTTLLVISLSLAPLVQAQNPTPPPSALPLEKYEEFGAIPGAPEGVTAEQQFKSAVAGIVNLIRPIIAALAILLIVVAGFRMVTAQGEAEAINKQKKAITWGIIGLIIVAISGDMQSIFGFRTAQEAQLQDCPITESKIQQFFLTPGQILCRVTLFNLRVQIVITFFKYLLGSVAVFEIVATGLRLVSGESEEKLEQDKKVLGGAVIGLMLVLISNTVITKVFYKLNFSKPATEGVHPGLDPAQGLAELAGFTNLIVSIIGPLAILVLMIGAVMYATAAGKEEQMQKARRLMFAAVIGIVIIFGAFAIVSTFVSRKF